MNAKGERLKAFREYLGYSQKALAVRYGTNQRNLSKYETGMTSIPEDIEEKLVHDGLNLNWLITGTGSMLLFDRVEDKEPHGSSRVGDGEMFSMAQTAPIQPATTVLIPSKASDEEAFKVDEPRLVASDQVDSLPALYHRHFLDGVSIFGFDQKHGTPRLIPAEEAGEESFVFVRVFSQRAAAGYGQDPTQLRETERTVPVMLSLFGVHRPVQCGLAQATGDSMIDVGIFGGDWCLFDMDDRKGDGIFMITMFGETRIKRLYYRLAERKIVIASENQKRYPDPELVSVEAMETGQLIVHGRVFASFHRMLV